MFEIVVGQDVWREVLLPTVHAANAPREFASRAGSLVPAPSRSGLFRTVTWVTARRIGRHHLLREHRAGPSIEAESAVQHPRQ